MSVIITDTGFAPDTFEGSFASVVDAPANAEALDIASDGDPSAALAHLDTVQLIRVDFPSFADGRGFTIARQLRLMGYAGRLRANGHIIADQYAMARRSGFDEVEIDAALAIRQPEAQWLARAQWRSHDYQSRLRGAVG